VRTDITLNGANSYRIQIEGDAISVLLIFFEYAKFICSNMSKRIRSDIWDRFEDVGNNKARCKLCRQDIGYRGGSTSSAETPATLSSNTAPTAGQACSVRGQAFDSTTERPRVTAADKLLSSLQSPFNRQRRPLIG
jgi:hypothetical protein